LWRTSICRDGFLKRRRWIWMGVGGNKMGGFSVLVAGGAWLLI